MLVGVAALVYAVDPVSQRFESLALFAAPFSLVSAMLPDQLHLPYGIRYWLPDFAWAGLAAVFAAEVMRAARAPTISKSMGIVLSACSWELLQWAGWVAGTYDVMDLLLSLAAGSLVVMLAWFRPHKARGGIIHETSIVHESNGESG